MLFHTKMSTVLFGTLVERNRVTQSNSKQHKLCGEEEDI